MSDVEWILLVLAAFYAYECAYWMRPGSVLFLSPFGFERHFIRFLHSAALLRNDQGGLVFGSLLPLGNSSLGQQWPLSLSPDGILAHVAQVITPEDRLPPTNRFWRFHDVRSVTTQHREVLINGTPFVSVNSPAMAETVATRIRTLSQLPVAQRQAAIEAILKDMWDFPRLRRRFQETRRRAISLKIVCSFLFLYVFVIVPVQLQVNPAAFTFLDLACRYFVLLALSMVIYFWTHGSLHPEKKGERYGRLIMMVFSPADAIHAADSLFRELACPYHPLAAAYVLCAEENFQNFAGRVLRDMHHPLPPASPLADEGLRKVAEWFRIKQQQALEQFLRETGTLPEKLLAPPRPESDECLSYCPRCLGQYVLAAGECHTCHLALRTFGPCESD